MKNNSIDIVIPWVNGSDLNWQNDFKNYLVDQTNIDARIHRYRDNGLLRFWFRGIEKNAPWIRKIHFITYGHIPEWLNTKHEKLSIVKHIDYIDKRYLPTFNSHVIELNLHRIPNLSDKFVYFNDDTFLINPIKEDFYFKNDLPRDCAILNPIVPGGLSHIIINNLQVINKHYNKSSVIRKNPYKWINIKYGFSLFRTLLLMPWPNFVGIKDTHLPIPYLKKTFERLWELEPEILYTTNESRFRKDSDVNQYLFRYWQLVSGDFNSQNTIASSSYLDISRDAISKIVEQLNNKKNKLIVINDGHSDEYEIKTMEIKKAFSEILPEKSTYEI
ncbi:Stealth CR1 domain-containing protein [Scandinavium goeteborgense]|uniref:Stealth CR1 domain-containing protein n=1 Tax=Scandinavium goeteborgense TaxID=1851514 RepID=UPI0021650034|nr:Stealth CR1 domain-containing protein [Scandinavium goeteborgense]MCS2154921.1 Stealth CR1 domain-containing protein [Scandinavium goeteborgense]